MVPAPTRDPVRLGFHAAPCRGDLLSRAERAVDRALGPFGIAGRCRSLPRGRGLPSVPVWTAAGPRRAVGTASSGVDVVGMGVAEDDPLARIKAVVEVVERYCFSAPVDPSSIVRAAEADLPGACVPLSAFALYSPAQYRATPMLRFPSPGEAIDWTWAFSIRTGEFRLVPAGLALATLSHGPPNNYTRWVMSTGVAAHVSLPSAILAGLFEVVERDALMIHWLHRRQPRRVDLQSAPAELVQMVRSHFSLPGVEFVLLDFTLDSGIPTLGCLALSDDPARPALLLGAATRLDPAEAARKALFETAQLLYALHARGWVGSTSFPEGDVRTLWDHARFYAGAEGARRARFLAESASAVPFGELPALATGDPELDLEVAVGRLAAVGLDPLVVDLTAADAGRCGFRVVRVLAPGAVDINGDVRFPTLGGARVRSAARAAGWPELAEHDLNRAPCPMS